jgi:putative ABC transport system substrate-binding protein
MATAPRLERRHVLALLASGALAVPRAVEALPEPGITRIGMLFAVTPASARTNLEAFRQGLTALGHVEGKTFVLEVRYGEARPDRLGDLVRDLLRVKPGVIVVSVDPVVAAVKKQTATIPIVMFAASDPVGTGLVASLGRPGGNVTGLTLMSPELGGKRLQLLSEAVPGLARVAFLWNPDVRGAVLEYKEVDQAARSLRLELHAIEVSRVEDLDRAFSSLGDRRVQALVLGSPNPVAFSSRPRIVTLAQTNRIPAMFYDRTFVEAGGLMSYGPSVADLARRAATYVDKIVKGARPADLPVEQPTSFELAINGKTARALALSIPQPLLLRANRVIQ